MSTSSESGSHGRAAFPAVAAVLAVVLASAGCDAPASLTAATAHGIGNRSVEAATYRVTVTNTAEALQPLTPSVVAIHNPAVSVFEVGAPASDPVERVAESGAVPVLRTALEETNQVLGVGVAFGTVNGQPGPILPGASGSVEVQAPPGRAMQLSLLSMLVCTNDGITGLSGADLPEEVGDKVMYMADGYDAGTEQNTEAEGDLVPPCVQATTGKKDAGTGADQPGIAEDDVIRKHPGIDPDTDRDDILDAEHQWTDPVATIEIERIQ